MKRWYRKSKKVKYIRTFKDWILHKLSKLIAKYSTILLLLYISVIPLAFLIYLIPFPWNEKLFKIFTWSKPIAHIHDGDVKKVIQTIIGSLTIIISLISAIYVFTYREQKSVAPSASANSKRNKWVMLVISCMVFNITFGSLLVSKYGRFMKEAGYKESLSVTEKIFLENLLMLFTLFLLVYLIIGLVKHLFKTMSVNKMLQDSIQDTSQLFDKIVYADRNSRFKELLDEWYTQLHYSIESVFQNFKFAAENNMNKEFQHNIGQFEKMVIKKFKLDTERYNIGFVHSYLIEEGETQFLEIYRSALRSNLSLISSLMKNQHYNKAKDLVELYFNMYIAEEQFIRMFQNNLAIYIDTIDTSDEKQLSMFLNGISTIPKEQTLFVSKYLIMKLITKNQLINLTNAVYALKPNLDNPTFKNSTVIILLQNLIKSIEISNYATTGFLVKFLVTNISGKDINRGLRILKLKPELFTTIWEERQEDTDENSFKGINEHPVYPIQINKETFDYCLRKAFILLYGQHLYSVRANLWFTKDREEDGQEIKLNKSYKGFYDSEYIIAKVKTASSKYGLLFFEDAEVMKAIYKKLGLFYNEVNENEISSLPNVISQTLIKLFKL
ncbi:hypothetical protein [Priestia aryabhattai]|uniref:hypothetical protein n=1 Tax=Priestia aryabhattai TaxID=412384 RepID=UPI002E1FF709|nr:hypothetical protein [Priestia aryabhattai]